ncbi:hypothetical protein [Streptomyces kaempferi]|uniref:Uncharacterized protein n=1 Tax=Streptomyces kaempferi TaxID=333725 RepID=A0ABW3XWQ5_9ACTN
MGAVQLRAVLEQPRECLGCAQAAAGRAGVPLLRHRVILMALLRRRYP